MKYIYNYPTKREKEKIWEQKVHRCIQNVCMLQKLTHSPKLESVSLYSHVCAQCLICTQTNARHRRLGACHRRLSCHWSLWCVSWQTFNKRTHTATFAIKLGTFWVWHIRFTLSEAFSLCVNYKCVRSKLCPSRRRCRRLFHPFLFMPFFGDESWYQTSGTKLCFLSVLLTIHSAGTFRTHTYMNIRIYPFSGNNSLTNGVFNRARKRQCCSYCTISLNSFELQLTSIAIAHKPLTHTVVFGNLSNSTMRIENFAELSTYYIYLCADWSVEQFIQNPNSLCLPLTSQWTQCHWCISEWLWYHWLNFVDFSLFNISGKCTVRHFHSFF